MDLTAFSVFSPIQPAPLQQLVTRRLIHAIFVGEISGGVHLTEQELSTQFKISRAPVREALREIAAMGFVELRPNRGSVVLPFNPDSLRGIYEVRSALECRAALLTAKRIPLTETEAFEGRIREALDSSDRNPIWSDKVIALDKEFHEMILTWAGVSRLAMEVRRYSFLAHLIAYEIRETRGHDFQEQVDAMQSHLPILQAFRHRDAPGAAQAMLEHLAAASERAVVGLFPKYSPPNSSLSSPERSS